MNFNQRVWKIDQFNLALGKIFSSSNSAKTAPPQQPITHHQALHNPRDFLRVSYYPLIGLCRYSCMASGDDFGICYAPELFVVNFSVDKPIHQSIGNFTAHLLVYGFVDWIFHYKELRLYKHLATKNISGDLASPDAKSQNPIFGWSELFVVNFSVDKPIHQSIGNFTAHLLVYGFVEWKFLWKKIWR